MSGAARAGGRRPAACAATAGDDPPAGSPGLTVTTVATNPVSYVRDTGAMEVSGGTLRADITVTFSPTVGAGTVVFRQGQTPSPQRVSLPAPGVVEEYPFDSYQIDVAVHAIVSTGIGDAETWRPIPVSTSLLFRIPGWRTTEVSAATAQESAWLSTTVARSGSTIAIAAMILILMLALAVIAALVVRAALRGRMKLEISVASWITAMLFALIPLRGFLPGQPPIGSWIDILIFFWVELALMLCVGIVAAAMIIRARRAHQQAVGTP